jgi:hypothetical protein
MRHATDEWLWDDVLSVPISPPCLQNVQAQIAASEVNHIDVNSKCALHRSARRALLRLMLIDVYQVYCGGMEDRRW